MVENDCVVLRMKIIKIIIIGLAFCMSSCFQKGDSGARDKSIVLEKCVYRDGNNVWHINSNCIKLRQYYRGYYALCPMDTAEFIIANKQDFYVCTHCIDEENFGKLTTLSNRNIYMRDLYNTLTEKGCPLPDFGIFRNTLMRSEADRRMIYEALRSDGADIETNFEFFNRRFH